jgi:hypothetical protein
MRSPTVFATNVGNETAAQIGYAKTLPTDYVKTLVVVIEGVEPTLRTQVCAEAGEVLTHALKQEPASLTEGVCEGLAKLSARLEPADAARICTPAARFLMAGLDVDSKPDLGSVLRIAKGCTLLAGRLEDADAERLQSVCGEQARNLTDRLRAEKWSSGSAEGLRTIIATLSEVVTAVDSADAARLCGEAVQALIALHEQVGKNDTELDSSVNRGLVQLVPRMQPEEAARLLSDALRRSPNAPFRGDLAAGLASVAVRMDTEQRAAVCAATARDLLQGMHRTTDHNDLGHLARGLAAVVPHMKPEEQAPFYSEAAGELIAGMRSSTGMPEEERRDQALLAIATKMERRQQAQVCGDAARAITETDESQIPSRIWRPT